MTPAPRGQASQRSLLARLASPSSRTLVLALAFTSSLALTTLGCDDEDSEIGTPCESEEDCSDELICDMHDGQGTCQEDHGHREIEVDEGRPDGVSR